MSVLQQMREDRSDSGVVLQASHSIIVPTAGVWLPGGARPAHASCHGRVKLSSLLSVFHAMTGSCVFFVSIFMEKTQLPDCYILPGMFVLFLFWSREFCLVCFFLF